MSAHTDLQEIQRRFDVARTDIKRRRDELAEIDARAEGRERTAGEQERWNRISRSVEKSNADLAAIETERNAVMRRFIDENPQNVISGDGAGPVHTGPAFHRGRDPWVNAPRTDAERRDAALFAIERSAAPIHAQETAEHLVRTNGHAAEWARVASNPEYLTAFQKVWNDPQRGHLEWSDAERAAHRDVVGLQRAASLTDASGGYMVPFTLDPAIMLTSAGSVNPMRRVSRIRQTVTDSWNGVTSDGVTAAWYAEAAQVTDDSPTLAQPSIPVHRGSAFIPFSIEVGMDAPGFAQECAKLLADAKDQLEATAFTTGSGSGQPKGIITAVAADSGSIVAPTTAEVFASTDTYAVQEAVPARWRANASFMANLSIINKVRQFDTSGGSLLLAQLGDATPTRLLGWNLYENSVMDGTYSAAATAAHNYLLLAGAFEHYSIVDRLGAVVELVPHLMGANGRPTGQRGYFCHWRTGGDCTNTDAFRLLDIPTTA